MEAAGIYQQKGRGSVIMKRFLAGDPYTSKDEAINHCIINPAIKYLNFLTGLYSEVREKCAEDCRRFSDDPEMVRCAEGARVARNRAAGWQKRELTAGAIA